MQLKRLTNDKPLWESFCEELDQRIAFCHRKMEQYEEAHELYRLQGHVAALKGLKMLRDKLNNG